jgi:hypothetical protein
MKGAVKAKVVRIAHRTAAAVAVILCLAAPRSFAQHSQAPRPAPHSRPSGFHEQPNRNQSRPQQMNRPRAYSVPQSPGYRSVAPRTEGFRTVPQNPRAQFPQNSMRPVAPGQTYQGRGYGAQGYPGPGYVRPNYPGVGGAYAPPGHLGAWLDAHRGVPAQQQEQMLHNDPSFNRLPSSQQQRLMQQLNKVDQMPEAQRERRLARAENLERLSPQQRAQVQDSARRWTTLPSDRRAVMKSAFQDLRNVPPDQRSMVLNSARYQNAFSPEERGILSNMLSVEPYQPPR